MAGTKKSSALELKLPPDFHPNGSPIGFPSRVPFQTCPGSGVSKHPAFPPKSRALRRSPPFPTACLLRCCLTVCPLTCKQAQPSGEAPRGRTVAPRAAPARVGVPQVGAELSVSSATCCSRVLRLRAVRRGFASAEPAAAPPAPPRPTALSTGVLASRSRPSASGRGAGTPRGRGRGGGRKGRQGAAQLGSPLGKSSGSLLLAKANTSSFPTAPTRRAHGQPHSVLLAECSASSGKEPGVQSALGRIPKTAPHTEGAGRPQGARLAAEGRERSLHH